MTHSQAISKLIDLSKIRIELSQKKKNFSPRKGNVNITFHLIVLYLSEQKVMIFKHLFACIVVVFHFHLSTIKLSWYSYRHIKGSSNTFFFYYFSS